MTFKPFNEACVDERKYRMNIDFPSLPSYGIKPLDAALRAIARNELIVIGASSGYGKTEMALAISRHNAMNGKKVAHYNLEGGWREAVTRIKWAYMCDIYFEKHKGAGLELDYRKWSLNEIICPLFLELEQEAEERLKDTIGSNLYLYDSKEGLNCKSFCRSLETFEDLRLAITMDFLSEDVFKKTGDKPDLVVIDHLHYFNLTRSEDESTEITEILRAVKSINDRFDIPVILVAHLRKLPRDHGIPDKEDIFGTSNIHKIANTCIIIAPDHVNDDPSTGVYPTYIRVAKSRQGIRPNLLIHTHFDIRERRYCDEFNLYKCSPNGQVSTTPLPDYQKPAWAIQGRKD